MSNDLTNWDVYSDESDEGGNDLIGKGRINEATKLLFLRKYATSNLSVRQTFQFKGE